MTIKNIRVILLEKALAMEVQATKIRTFIRNADRADFDWQNVDEVQLDTIQSILEVKLNRQEK